MSLKFFYILLSSNSEVKILLILGAIVFFFFWNWIQKARYKSKYQKSLEDNDVINNQLQVSNNAIETSKEFKKELESEILELKSNLVVSKKLSLKSEQQLKDQLLKQKKSYDEKITNLSFANNFYSSEHKNIKDSSKHIEVQAINTRLSAHFLKNVLTKIHIEHKKQETGALGSIKKLFVINDVKKELLPIDILGKINILLDYNVSTLYTEKIELQKEIDKVELFLDIFKFLEPKAKITTNFKLDSVGLKISPTLCFPFLENALKHGFYNHGGHVSIDLFHIDNSIIYQVENSINPDLPKEKRENLEGFGMNSLKKGLSTYYRKHTLKQRVVSNNFISTLKVTV